MPISKPAEAGQIWVQDGDIVSLSSPVCTLAAVKKFTAAGKKLNAAYLVDHALGIKVFADQAFYAVGGQDPQHPELVPFLLKKDAQEYATKIGGKLASYSEAVGAADPGH